MLYPFATTIFNSNAMINNHKKIIFFSLKLIHSYLEFFSHLKSLEDQ